MVRIKRKTVVFKRAGVNTTLLAEVLALELTGGLSILFLSSGEKTDTFPKLETTFLSPPTMEETVFFFLPLCSNSMLKLWRQTKSSSLPK